MKKILFFVILCSIILIPNKCFGGRFLFWYWPEAIRFKIIDANTMEPISNVEVRMICNSKNKSSKYGKTNKKGEIWIKKTFFSFFGPDPLFLPPPIKLIFKNPKYETLEIPFVYWEWKPAGRWNYNSKYIDMNTKTAEIILRRKQEQLQGILLETDKLIYTSEEQIKFILTNNLSEEIDAWKTTWKTEGLFTNFANIFKKTDEGYWGDFNYLEFISNGLVAFKIKPGDKYIYSWDQRFAGSSAKVGKGIYRLELKNSKTENGVIYSNEFTIE